MQENFTPYNEAIELKKLRYTEPCFSFYSCDNKDKIYYCVDPDDLTLNWDNHSKHDYNNLSYVYRTSAPLYQQVFKWFRDKHNLQSVIESNANHEIHGKKTYSITIFYSFGNCFFDKEGEYNTYEEAELSCVQKLIEILKQKQ